MSSAFTLKRRKKMHKNWCGSCAGYKKSPIAEAIGDAGVSMSLVRQLLDALVKTRRRPAGHDADGGSVLILLGAVTILIKLL